LGAGTVFFIRFVLVVSSIVFLTNSISHTIIFIPPIALISVDFYISLRIIVSDELHC
jgi:hypothetical protein